MPWIESHQELKDHPKLFHLCEIMGWDPDQAIGKLHRFWWWCLSYAWDGDLRKFNDGQIASGMGVAIPDGKRLVEALVQSRWIDREPYFRVHDWWDYVGAYLEIKYKDKKEKWQTIKDAYKGARITGAVTHPVTQGTGPTVPTGPTNQPRGACAPPPSKKSGGAGKVFISEMKVQLDEVNKEVSKLRESSPGSKYKDAAGKFFPEFDRYYTDLLTRRKQLEDDIRGVKRPVV